MEKSLSTLFIDTGELLTINMTENTVLVQAADEFARSLEVTWISGQNKDDFNPKEADAVFLEDAKVLFCPKRGRHMFVGNLLSLVRTVRGNTGIPIDQSSLILSLPLSKDEPVVELKYDYANRMYHYGGRDYKSSKFLRLISNRLTQSRSYPSIVASENFKSESGGPLIEVAK